MIAARCNFGQSNKFETYAHTLQPVIVFLRLYFSNLMGMKSFLFVTLMLFTKIVYGQHKYDYTWLFGSINGNGTILSFKEEYKIINNVFLLSELALAHP